MYLHTRSTSDLETENAAADCCHEKFPRHNLFSLIKRAELSAIIVARTSSEYFGEREMSKCTCSGLANMEYIFESLLLTMPVMYFSIRILDDSSIIGFRLKVVKIKCI